jgi:hypothetical protein
MTCNKAHSPGVGTNASCMSAGAKCTCGAAARGACAGTTSCVAAGRVCASGSQAAAGSGLRAHTWETMSVRLHHPAAVLACICSCVSRARDADGEATGSGRRGAATGQHTGKFVTADVQSRGVITTRGGLCVRGTSGDVSVCGSSPLGGLAACWCLSPHRRAQLVCGCQGAELVIITKQQVVSSVAP